MTIRDNSVMWSSEDSGSRRLFSLRATSGLTVIEYSMK